MDAVDNKSMQSCVNIEQSNTLEATTNCKGSINLCKNQLLRELTKQCTINYEDFFKNVTNKQKALDNTSQNVQLMNNCLPNKNFVHKNENSSINDNIHEITHDNTNETEENCKNSEETPSNCNSIDDTTTEALLNTNTELTTETTTTKSPQITPSETLQAEAETDNNSIEQNSNCSLNNQHTTTETTAVDLKKPSTEAATETTPASISAITADEENAESNEIHINNLKIHLPVDYTAINNHVDESNHSRHSRCSSVSSTASSSSTNSSSTHHLVIDQPNIVDTIQLQQEHQPPESVRETEDDVTEEEQQLQNKPEITQSSRKRKLSSSSSSGSSSTDTEEPPAKHIQLDCVTNQEESSEELRSPLKLKIKCTPRQTPEHEKLSTYDIHEQKLTSLSSTVTALLNTVRNNVARKSGENNAKATDTVSATEAAQQISSFLAAPINVELEEKTETILDVRENNQKHQTSVESTAPPVPPPVPIKPPLLKCMQCQTLHEYGSFFMHAYQKHNRYLCLYCNGSFRTAEKLSVHLEIKHDLEQNHFNSEDAMRKYVSEAAKIENAEKYIMCCTCQHVFVDHEPFSNHDCTAYMQPCSLCGQMGRHSNHCKAHPDASRRNKFNASLQQKVKPPSISSIFPQTAVTNCDIETTNTPELSVEKQQQIETTTAGFNNEPYQTTHTKESAADMSMLWSRPASLIGEQQEQNTEGQEEETLDAEAEPNPAPKLVVPKFKLRVPKEFQKSVDSALSSTDYSDNEDLSETDVEDEEDAQQTAQKQLENEIEPTPHHNVLDAAIESENKETTHAEEELNSNINVTPEEHAAEIHEKEYDAEIASEKSSPSECATVHTNGPSNQWTHTPPASPTQARAVETNDTNIPTELLTELPIEQSTVKEQNNTILTEDQQVIKTSAILTPKTSSATDENTNVELKTQSIAIVEQEKDMAMNINLTTENETNVDVEKPVAEEEEIEVVKSAENSFVDVEVPEEDIIPIELTLDQPLDNYSCIDFVRLCLKQSYPICLYCNHARRIAVNAHNLVLHMLEQHRYIGVMENLNEKLETKIFVEKLKTLLPELDDEYFNLYSYSSKEVKISGAVGLKDFNERIYECFMCRFVATTHKELYLHNRKMHLRSAVFCFMCRANFASFSEILCHICPGKPNEINQIDLKYRCCLCNLPDIPSTFRLMVHLRMKHFSCDVCLENCFDQMRLSLHVFKHKVRHLCHRCGIAYRNKTDIENHLFWKHSTEGIKCKRCLRKRWRHVYHFCTPPTSFICDICNMCFSKAMYLNVHSRSHTDILKYPCTAEGCEDKFIARKLLEKHITKNHQVAEQTEIEIKNETETENKMQVKCEKDTNDLEKIESDKNLVGKEELVEKNVTNETAGISNIAEESNTTTENQSNEIQTDIGKDSVIKRKKKSKKDRKLAPLDFLNLQSPNLSESDSSSSDDDSSASEHTPEKIDTVPEQQTKAKSIDKEEETNSNKTEENVAKVMEMWRNYVEDRDKSLSLAENKQQQETDVDTFDTKIEDNNKMTNHVGTGEHDYCRLDTPPQSNKKPKKHKKNDENLADKKEEVQENESSSDSSSDDDSSSCCSDENCSCSDKDSDNSNGSESDSSLGSNHSISQRKKNKSKESTKSSHKKQKESETIGNITEENKEQLTEAQNIEVNEAIENREPEFLESDLATSECDSSEEFYDEHPQKAANELLLQQRAQLTTTNNLFASTPVHDDVPVNGDQELPNIYDSPLNKKKLKRKRDKRNNNNALLNKFVNLQQPPLYAETMETHNNFTDNYLSMDQNSVYNNYMNTPISGVDAIHYPGHLMSFAAEQTVVTAGNAFSEGGGSSSEPDGPLKRSKRNRRPNKFYGYTSDDDSINTSHGPRMMIGMRAFKPTPPPQLTWHKEDLPSPSKSILNNSKSKTVKTTHTKLQSTEDLSTDVGTLVMPDNRSRTFGIAAGGKVGGGGAFYKRAAKRSNFKSRKVSSAEEESHQLPPIPRLKIKPTVNMKLLNISENSVAMQQSSTEGLEQEMDDGSSTSSTSSSDDEQVENKPSRRKPNVGQTSSAQLGLTLPTPPLATPVPNTRAFNHDIPPALLPNPDFATLQYFKVNNIRYPIRPPAGARLAREGESVYCYCRCPYDEVSEMIACDGDCCLIEWFHFECVGIMMAPQGKWYCAECRPKHVTEIYGNKTQ